jgi:hypothetical protein
MLMASCVWPFPSEELGDPMPVIAQATADGGGWTLQVPICGADDGIAGFTYASSGGANPKDNIGTRGSPRAGSTRIAVLTVSATTIRDGTINPDEVKVVSTIGTPDPNAGDFSLRTVHGYTQGTIDLANLADLADGTALLFRGDEQPETVNPAAVDLLAFCHDE